MIVPTDICNLLCDKYRDRRLMKFLCTSCGSSHETTKVSKFPQKKTCSVCNDKFTASQTNRLIDIRHHSDPVESMPAGHVFFDVKAKTGFFFHSSFEKFVFYGVTIIGIIVLTAAFVSNIIG